ncbi:MAG: glycoside hydrolase family 3 C-terminal domain-containing protein [Clostridia bacterium]|nr:glycoside hydrolase family 3 C-terminal domain-containing protein [Clostridia bacterium]
MKATGIFRALTALSCFVLIASLVAGPIMESYRQPIDTYFGETSYRIEGSGQAEWIYQSEFKTQTEAIEGLRAFAIEEALESFVLLKNEGDALPLSEDSTVTLLGLRSYAPVYGNSMGAAPDTTVIQDGNQSYLALEKAGLKINPVVLQKYKDWVVSKGGNLTADGQLFGEYAGAGSSGPSESGDLDLTGTDTAPEAKLGDLGLTADDYAGYTDVAIVTVGRPGGESKNYVTGGTDSTTTNIFGLSQDEKAVIEEAKANFDKVILLVNSINPLELREVKEDADVDAILWIGYPGAYGFYAVPDVLFGKTAPSGHLGDIYLANSAVSPAMVSFGGNGDVAWANKDEFTSDDNVNSYLINEEGIYTGYRYFETRYADVVAGVNNAEAASAGTYTNPDTTIATQDGTWQYDNEVVYPFGYGLSYTSFEQTLDSVTISGDKKTADVTVTVKNTGSVPGKSVIQLYAQSPYTDYDRENLVEKSAVQLMDYEKTQVLAAGASETITLHVDMANLASYDVKGAGTYILDAGDYYFAIGRDSHDALNNILAAQGQAVDGSSEKTYTWNVAELDKTTFATSKNGTEIHNVLSSGDYSMDINTFEGYEGTANYMSRQDWNGTYPKLHAGLSATGRIATLLRNDVIPLTTGAEGYTWGAQNGMTIYEMIGASWDDDRWDTLVDQVTPDEFVAFASNAFHNIEGIPSVNYSGHKADDGPGGSDGGTYLNDGRYQGTMYSTMSDFDEQKGGYGTRIAPTPTNLAYTWNKELAYRNGELILGESTLMFDYPIMIGPGINLHRHGYNGRGGEYYSEDPILSGYTGSAVIQGAQSKGTIVNVKHLAFNDQEINRSGIAVFMTEQAAREMELRNFQQTIEASGKPASMYDNKNVYVEGALGVMTSFNRIGAVAPSANKGVCQDILRDEWGFRGYSVTDFTGVSMKAMPKESVLYGTVAFCGFGGAVDYFTGDTLSADPQMAAALKQDIKYILYPLVNSAAMNGADPSMHRVEIETSWRALYHGLQLWSGIATGVFALGYVICAIAKGKKKGGN